MKPDTKTFLATMLGIPTVLSFAWSVHTLDEASMVIVDNEPVTYTQEPAQEPEVIEVVPASKPVVARKPTPVAVASVPTPSTNPAPTPTPVVVVQKPTTTTQAPKPVPKKVRRTRAS